MPWGLDWVEVRVLGSLEQGPGWGGWAGPVLAEGRGGPAARLL